MNIEFHYYILYILLIKAGFSEEEAYVISYSSQYVDNSIVSQKVKFNDSVYEGIVTQNYGWWSDWFPYNVYIPFHFIPGDADYPQALRKDGRVNPFNVTPSSKNANHILDEAFKTNNLYRIGIALHTFADTFTHQNFSGLNESWNVVDTDTILPNVGHAEVLSKPDIVCGKWTDKRLAGNNSNIDNRQRVLSAAKAVYIKLCWYLKKDAADVNDVADYVDSLIGKDDPKNYRMKERVLDYILAEDIFEYSRSEWISLALYYSEESIFSREEIDEMDKLVWLKDALFYKTSILKKPLLYPRDGFFESHWYKWNEAAKKHLDFAKNIVAGT